MNPGRYNITVYQGTTFALSPQWLINNLAVNLTGYSAIFQVRQFVDSPTALTTASTANGKIILEPALGKLNILIQSTETATFPTGNYLYDLNLTAPDGITVYKILNGNFTVSPSVVH